MVRHGKRDRLRLKSKGQAHKSLNGVARRKQDAHERSSYRLYVLTLSCASPCLNVGLVLII